MSANLKQYAIVAVAGYLTASVPAKGQEQDSMYALVLYAGAGYSRNFSPFGDAPEGLRRNGLGASVRVMWKPEHLLRVGLEAGITQIYSVQQKGVQSPFGVTDFSSYLNAIPLALTFSMPLTDRLEGYIGSTSYLLFSRTESYGNSTTGFMLSIGFSAGLTYLWMMNDDWQVGSEVKWYHIEKSRDDNIMVYLVLSFPILEW